MLTVRRFGAVMLIGAAVTWFFLPEVQYSNKESKTLGVLARGHEQRMESRRTQAPSQDGENLEMGNGNSRDYDPDNGPHNQ